MLENDDVSKLSIDLNIYFFFLCRHFSYPKCRGISVKDSNFIEVFTLRCLLITCPNKTSKVFTLKLTADLIPVPVAWTLPKMFNSIFKAFSDMLRVSKIVSLKSWLHFGFGIKMKRGLSPSTYTTTQITFEQPSSVLWKSQFSPGGSGLLETEVNSFQLSTIITKSSILDVDRGPGLVN